VVDSGLNGSTLFVMTRRNLDTRVSATPSVIRLREQGGAWDLSYDPEQLQGSYVDNWLRHDQAARQAPTFQFLVAYADEGPTDELLAEALPSNVDDWFRGSR
jgi:hypothetical protein